MDAGMDVDNGVLTSDIEVKDERHLKRLLHVVPECKLYLVSDIIWRQKANLFPSQKLSQLLRVRRQKFIAAGVPQTIAATSSLLSIYPSTLYSLQDALDEELPEIQAPTSSREPTERRKNLVHPASVVDNDEFATETRAWYEEWEDPFASEALYPLCLNSSQTGSIHEVSVHQYLNNKCFYLINQFLWNLTTAPGLTTRQARWLKIDEDGSRRPFAWQNEVTTTPSVEELEQDAPAQDQSGSCDWALKIDRLHKGNTEAKNKIYGPNASEAHQNALCSASSNWNREVPYVNERQKRRCLYFIRDGLAQGLYYCQARKLKRFCLTNGSVSYFAAVRSPCADLSVSPPVWVNSDAYPNLRQSMLRHTIDCIEDQEFSFNGQDSWKHDDSAVESSRSKKGPTHKDEQKPGSRPPTRPSASKKAHSKPARGVRKRQDTTIRSPLGELNLTDFTPSQSSSPQAAMNDTNDLDALQCQLNAASLDNADFGISIHKGDDSEVFSLRRDGMNIAAKLAPIGSQGEEKIRKEYRNYQALAGLQSSAITKVVAAGKSRRGDTYILGTDMQSAVFDLDFDRELYPSALRSLKAIHEKGWVHGDIHPRNLCKSRDARMIFIDLEKAHKFTDQEEAEQELRALARMFLQ